MEARVRHGGLAGGARDHGADPLAAAVAIRLDSKGTIFYRQTRAAFLEPFRYSSAPMVEGGARDRAVFASARTSDHAVGHLLRRRGDELHTVLKCSGGDGIVGKRPERPEFGRDLRAIPYFGCIRQPA